MHAVHYRAIYMEHFRFMRYFSNIAQTIYLSKFHRYILHVGEEVSCVSEVFRHHVRSKCEIGRTLFKIWSANVWWPTVISSSEHRINIWIHCTNSSALVFEGSLVHLWNALKKEKSLKHSFHHSFFIANCFIKWVVWSSKHAFIQLSYLAVLGMIWQQPRQKNSTSKKLWFLWKFGRS